MLIFIIIACLVSNVIIQVHTPSFVNVPRSNSLLNKVYTFYHNKMLLSMQLTGAGSSSNLHPYDIYED